MMYILYTTDGINFKVVAQCHPSSVPDEHKQGMNLTNTPGNKEVTTVAIYTDKSWEKLPLTKKFVTPRELVLR